MADLTDACPEQGQLDYWTCGHCGKQCSRKRVKGQRPKWCGKRCSNLALAVRRGMRPCAWCGDMYRPNWQGQATCSRQHAQFARHYGRPCDCTDLVLVRQPRAERARPIVEAPRPWWRVIVQGDCASCGEAFTALSTTGDSRYCSDRCSRRAQKLTAYRKVGRFAVSTARRRRLHDRDDWTCQICRFAVSRSWSHDDPWSPTLDHIEPQSSSPAPDHSDKNLRTACALCNSIRRDGALSDEAVRGLVLGRRSADVTA